MSPRDHQTGLNHRPQNAAEVVAAEWKVSRLPPSEPRTSSGAAR